MTSSAAAVFALLALASGTAIGCGGGDTTSQSSSGAPTTTAAAPSAKLEKIVDTASSVKAASAAKLSRGELDAQAHAIQVGIEDAGFTPTNVGTVGGAVADIVVDTSWGVYVYDSDRSASEFALTMQDIYPDPANYEMFRLENRIYVVSKTSKLSTADIAKIEKIALAAEKRVA